MIGQGKYSDDLKKDILDELYQELPKLKTQKFLDDKEWRIFCEKDEWKIFCDANNHIRENIQKLLFIFAMDFLQTFFELSSALHLLLYIVANELISKKDMIQLGYEYYNQNYFDTVDLLYTIRIKDKQESVIQYVMLYVSLKNKFIEDFDSLPRMRQIKKDIVDSIHKTDSDTNIKRLAQLIKDNMIRPRDISLRHEIAWLRNENTDSNEDTDSDDEEKTEENIIKYDKYPETAMSDLAFSRPGYGLYTPHEGFLDAVYNQEKRKIENILFKFDKRNKIGKVGGMENQDYNDDERSDGLSSGSETRLSEEQPLSIYDRRVISDSFSESSTQQEIDQITQQNNVEDYILKATNNQEATMIFQIRLDPYGNKYLHQVGDMEGYFDDPNHPFHSLSDPEREGTSGEPSPRSNSPLSRSRSNSEQSAGALNDSDSDSNSDSDKEDNPSHYSFLKAEKIFRDELIRGTHEKYYIDETYQNICCEPEIEDFFIKMKNKIQKITEYSDLPEDNIFFVLIFIYYSLNLNEPTDDWLTFGFFDQELTDNPYFNLTKKLFIELSIGNLKTKEDIDISVELRTFIFNFSEIKPNNHNTNAYAYYLTKAMENDMQKYEELSGGALGDDKEVKEEDTTMLVENDRFKQIALIFKKHLERKAEKFKKLVLTNLEICCDPQIESFFIKISDKIKQDILITEKITINSEGDKIIMDEDRNYINMPYINIYIVLIFIYYALNLNEQTEDWLTIEYLDLLLKEASRAGQISAEKFLKEKKIDEPEPAWVTFCKNADENYNLSKQLFFDICSGNIKTKDKHTDISSNIRKFIFNFTELSNIKNLDISQKRTMDTLAYEAEQSIDQVQTQIANEETIKLYNEELFRIEHELQINKLNMVELERHINDLEDEDLTQLYSILNNLDIPIDGELNSFLQDVNLDSTSEEDEHKDGTD
tara:strand:- start:10514 stop:13315 length:2802 start_codon:yes stop_codon:yes gene_type:complete